MQADFHPEMVKHEFDLLLKSSFFYKKGIDTQKPRWYNLSVKRKGENIMVTFFYVYFNDTERRFEDITEAEDFAEKVDGIICDASGEPIC